MTKKLKCCRELHEAVIESLTEMLDEAPELQENDVDSRDLQTHRFTLGASSCLVTSLPHNRESACINVNIRLGRLHSSYPRALRWLGHNRAFNTVSHANYAYHWDNRELWLASNRVTCADDHKGIRLMLEDINNEVQKVETGLGLWFPHMLSGLTLQEIEDYTEEDETVRALVNNPKHYLEWVRKNPKEAAIELANTPAVVCIWLQQWEEALHWVELCWNQRPANKKEQSEQISYLSHKALALKNTGRYEELLKVAQELDQLADPDRVSFDSTVMRCWAWSGLNQHEELLRRTQSSFYQSDHRLIYWRTHALAHVGSEEQCFACFEQHEENIGSDLFAMKHIGQIMRQRADVCDG